MLKIGRIILDACGVLFIIGIVGTINEIIVARKPKDDTVIRKGGKTYFKVQNEEREPECMGFHLG